MTVNSQYGPLIAPWNVEQAVLATVKDRIYAYLAEIERQNDLAEGDLPRPPLDESYHGASDFESFQQDRTPEIIAVVAPIGEPEREAATGYTQVYEAQLGAVVIGRDESDARMLAGLYATALAGAVLHQRGLDGFAQDTRMTAAPSVRLPDPDERRLTLGVCTFHVWVTPIVTDTGPLVLPAPIDQPPADSPTVATTQTDLSIRP